MVIKNNNRNNDKNNDNNNNDDNSNTNNSNYNLRQNIVEKSLKLSNLGFSMECCTSDLLQFRSTTVKTCLWIPAEYLPINSKPIRNFFLEIS